MHVPLGLSVFCDIRYKIGNIEIFYFRVFLYLAKFDFRWRHREKRGYIVTN